MKLPNAERAVVDVLKLREYCLSLSHPRGRHKARVFATVLGITADAEILQDALLSAARTCETTLAESDEYGQRYVLDFPMECFGKSASIRSGWIIRSGEDFPRLTSCFVR